MNYVSAVLAKTIEISIADSLPLELSVMGAHVHERGASVPYASRAELSVVLTALQRLGFLFADEPAGWPPAAVFQQLRDEAFVSGSVQTVTWTGPNEHVFGKA
ncbi:hypothetical protein RCH10_001898 [Variovorax sp. GrIS 2.14]|uniref:hypothetical protein n=1 Tax=Variovorax sp. GrIS 2.14 TaxID=3071709 RepID=UPI0038F780D3